MIKIHIKSRSKLDEVNELLINRGLQNWVSSSEDWSKELKIPLFVENGFIGMKTDWSNQRLPLLFPPVEYSPANLIGYICLVSELWQEAIDEFSSQSFKEHISALISDPNAFLDQMPQHIAAINRLILAIYMETEATSVIPQIYTECQELELNDRLTAFVEFHYASFGEENGLKIDGERYFDLLKDPELSIQARISLKWQMVNSYANGNFDLIDEQVFKNLLNELNYYYREVNAEYQLAPILELMASTASRENNFTEGLNYINEAIRIYESLDLSEMKATANLEKAQMLHIWAKQGFPQFYTKAIESYQEALRVFKKADTPQVFAQVHHQLGILYSELPSSAEKQKIWSALSASSFNEALEFFTKNDYPEVYASIAHNYGTALLHYPAGAQGDNVDRAINHFTEALQLRKKHPYEYSLTALNLLEALWEANNVNQTMERVRRKEMRKLVDEVISLDASEEMVSRAKEHQEALKETYKIAEVSNA